MALVSGYHHLILFTDGAHETSGPEIAMLDLTLQEVAAGGAVTFGASRQ